MRKTLKAALGYAADLARALAYGLVAAYAGPLAAEPVLDDDDG